MKNKKIIIKRIILLILILLWMYLVFGFSAQNSTESSGLSMKVASFFSDNELTQQKIEPIIRKIAHYSEYGLGGSLFFLFFSTFNIKEKNQIIFSILMGIIYASTDELHQLFVDGRSGQFTDVYIDTLGVITGVFIIDFLIRVIKNLDNKKKTV